MVVDLEGRETLHRKRSRLGSENEGGRGKADELIGFFTWNFAGPKRCFEQYFSTGEF
jgi:hypothetical protein